MPESFDIERLLGPPELAGFPPADDALIAWAEHELGVTLPDAYKRMARVHNGGLLYCQGIRPVERQFEWHSDREVYCVSEIFGINRGSSMNIVDCTRTARDEWGGPDGLVTLSGDGHWWLCLDYRVCGPNGQPQVVHSENDSETPIGAHEAFLVAPTFEALLGGLQLDHDGNYILGVSGLSREEIRKRVKELGTKPHESAHESAHALTFDRYDGLREGDPASIRTGEPETGARDAGYEHGRSLLGLEPDEIQIPVSVSHTQAEELIGKILGVLGPGARLVHCPMDGVQISQG